MLSFLLKKYKFWIAANKVFRHMKIIYLPRNDRDGHGHVYIMHKCIEFEWKQNEWSGDHTL